MPAATKPTPVVPGYRLDRYELLCPVAEGGMASVWVARFRGKRGFEKLVAIKMILPKFAQDPRFERMFLDEAGIASRIEHQNVAQILDLGEQHEILYLAMEWVDGDSLSKLLRVLQRQNKVFPPGVALRVLADVCAGLHAAHELRGKNDEILNVVHRDVSPQNVLVSSRGVAKLIDFGIAKARDRMTEETSGGTLKGKVHYMAPEQALGHAIDRRSDIWAVGAILYYLMCGRPPYEGENQLATLHLLASGKPPPRLSGDVHPAIVRIVDRALSPAPDHRYATAAEMQADLEAAMIEAKVATSTSDVAAFVRVHLADRIKRRKEILDLALSAAAERSRVADTLEAASRISSSGVGPLDDQLRHAQLTPVTAPEAQRQGAMGALPLAGEGSSATLGSAALEAGVASFRPARRPLRALLLALGLMACASAAVFVLRNRMMKPVVVTRVAAAAAQPPAAPPIALPSNIPPPPAASAVASAAPMAEAGAATAPSATAKPAAASLRPGSKPAATPPTPKRHRIDDGF